MNTNKAIFLFLALCVCSTVFMVDAKAAASPGPNLGVIPDAWEGYLTKGRVVHGPDPQIVFVDTSVTHNGHVSIRCDGPATTGNPWREVDAYGVLPGQVFQVKPGDHVVFNCWIKTAPSTLSNPTYGAMILIDLYGSVGRIWEVAWGYPASTDFNTEKYGAYKHVPYGSDWVQAVLDFIVPSKTFTSNSEGAAIPAQTVTRMIPVIQCPPQYPSREKGSAWFSDAELYINPNFTSTAPPPLPQNVANGQKWARTWYVYSGNSGSPWSQVLGSGPDESNLNFDNNWGSGTVAYSRSDRIGFVSTRTVNLSAGSWTFAVGGDDGVRLYVDDKLVINGWKNQAYTTYTYKTSFSSTADHSLRLEYYEYTGNARVSFSLKQG